MVDKNISVKIKIVKTLRELELLGLVKVRGERIYRTKFGQKVYNHLKNSNELKSIYDKNAT